MSIRWDKRNKAWRFEFDRYVQGVRHRASRLLPKGWSQAQADAFDRSEGARLYAVATGVEQDDPLIEAAVALYLRDKTALKSYKKAAEHLAQIAWAIEGRRMSELPAVTELITTNRLIASVDGGRREHVISLSTVKNRLALLKAACRWAWKKHGLVPHDPTATMQLPAVNNARRVYPKRREMLRAARAAVHHGTRVAIRVAFYSGFRLGELYRVRVEGDLLILDDTKNGKPRIVPAHPRILTCLRHLPLTMKRTTLQQDWRRVRAAGVRFHDLRHSAASEMINAGVDLHTVGKVLGHLDPRSTDRYAHLQVDTLAAAVRQIGRKSPHNAHAPGMKKAAAKAA